MAQQCLPALHSPQPFNPDPCHQAPSHDSAMTPISTLNNQTHFPTAHAYPMSTPPHYRATVLFVVLPVFRLVFPPPPPPPPEASCPGCFPLTHEGPSWVRINSHRFGPWHYVYDHSLALPRTRPRATVTCTAGSTTGKLLPPPRPPTPA